MSEIEMMMEGMSCGLSDDTPMIRYWGVVLQVM
jgi:hypothetical protein